MQGKEVEVKPYTVSFNFHKSPPESLIKAEHQRLNELKSEGLFLSLHLRKDMRGGTLAMQGASREEVEAALKSLPLYPFADWTVREDANG